MGIACWHYFYLALLFVYADTSPGEDGGNGQKESVSDKQDKLDLIMQPPELTNFSRAGTLDVKHGEEGCCPRSRRGRDDVG